MDADVVISLRPPRSATALGTGFAGVAGAIAGLLLVRGLTLPLYQKTLLVIGATAAAMILVDVGLFRTYRNSSTGLSPTALRSVSPDRIFRKCIGFYATLACLTTAYWLLPEYAGDFYGPVRSAAALCAPVVLLLAPVYILRVDRRQIEPEDALAAIGSFILRGKTPDAALVGQHIRGWLVKGFFLPLMFIYLTNDLDSMWKRIADGYPADFRHWYDLLYDIFYLFDVLFAAVGYIFTARVLDTHFRSAEPTLFGWVVCLMCYQPFWNIFEQSVFQYETDKFYWGGLFSGAAYVAWGSAILVLCLIYAWSTVAFGLRFSNLTHRGIITNGPYRWLRHPAYVSKNLSWWLISVPFLSNAGWIAGLKQSLLLLALNGIYALRAYTEERHLATDPAYRDYQTYMRHHGLVALIRRLVPFAAR